MADRGGDVDATPGETTNGASGVKWSWRVREGLRRERERRSNGRQTGVDAHVIGGQRLTEQFVR